jgi:lipopolysaccharide transport system ATP-binding protein
MSFEPVIEVISVSKSFQIYSQPIDRLKQSIFPRIQKALGISPKQYFKSFQALDNLTFSIERGDSVGIIGRNGSGKSTLLQIICSTLSQSEGEIITRGKVAALLELGSGFNPEFSGRENVFLNASLLGLTHKQTVDRFNEIEAFAEIGEFIDQPVKTYSSGMLVRLAFAVIAHVEAEILIIDEALAVGDAFFTQKCMRFLRNFMRTGTILFVSHDTSAVTNLCNKAIWIDRGKLLMSGPPKQVCEKYLEAFFESNQGESKAANPKDTVEVEKHQDFVDQRQDLLNGPSLRNDIELFSFNSQSAAFGHRGAQFSSVVLVDLQDRPLSWIVGGELVSLQATATALQPLDSLIIGFYINDKRGQTLFGDNTWLTYIEQPLSIAKGEQIKASFEFRMPRLAAGDYSITVAIANGTQVEHIQHHWIHDAIIFRSHSEGVANGIIGIPMNQIQVDIQKSKT